MSTTIVFGGEALGKGYVPAIPMTDPVRDAWPDPIVESTAALQCRAKLRDLADSTITNLAGEPFIFEIVQKPAISAIPGRDSATYGWKLTTDSEQFGAWGYLDGPYAGMLWSEVPGGHE